MKEIIVRDLNLEDLTYTDKGYAVHPIEPSTAYLVPILDNTGRHHRYVTDNNNNISRQGDLEANLGFWEFEEPPFNLIIEKDWEGAPPTNWAEFKSKMWFTYKPKVVRRFEVEGNEVRAALSGVTGYYENTLALGYTKLTSVRAANLIKDFNKINLSNNNISDWSKMVEFAHSMPEVSGGIIDTTRNPASSVDTEFEKIMTGKGWTFAST